MGIADVIWFGLVLEQMHMRATLYALLYSTSHAYQSLFVRTISLLSLAYSAQ